jgi:hypothetical protein
MMKRMRNKNWSPQILAGSRLPDDWKAPRLAANIGASTLEANLISLLEFPHLMATGQVGRWREKRLIVRNEWNCTERREAVQHESDTEIERIGENLSLKVAGRQVEVGRGQLDLRGPEGYEQSECIVRKMWVSV